MMGTYKTVVGIASASIIVKKSRFVAYVSAVSTLGEALDAQRAAAQHERTARHHAMACIVGDDAMEKKSDDDGEPAGTAGAPLLRALEHQELTNTVIVVSRIFGGIKLGAGGLVRAYGAAATAALREARICTMEPAVLLAVEVSHDMAPRMQHFLIEQGYDVGLTATVQHAVLHVVVLERDFESITGYLRTASRNSAKISIEGNRYLPAPYE